MLELLGIRPRESWTMKIPIPLIRYEVEITARRRTEPFRVRMKTMMIAVLIAAVVIYALKPLSAADRRLMAIYEQLGSNDPAKSMTKAQIISQLGPPASADPPSPNTAPGYSWVADFETPLHYQHFELNLSFDADNPDSQVTAWGLNKTECQGLELQWFRIMRLISRVD